MVNCSQIIAETLRAHGIRRIFGLPGGEVLELIDACRNVGIEFVLTRHESVGAFMADVTGQMTGTPGVCVSTVGPGATNLVSGVANAYLDRSPVLVFTAQVATASQPYASHQFIPLDRLFGPITKQAFTLTGEDTRRIIGEGIGLALAEPKGPVYFCLPSDVARREVQASEGESPSRVFPRGEGLDGGAVAGAIGELKASRRPLAILGVGIDPRRDVEAIRRFIRKNRLPVMATPKAKGIYPEPDPLFLGTASGMMADGLIVDMIRRADLVLGIGYDPVESDKIWHRDIKLLSLNGYSLAFKSYRPSLEVRGRIGEILERLMEEDFREHDWTAEDFALFRETLARKLQPVTRPRRGTFSPYDIMRGARRALPEDAILTIDVGAHKFLLGQGWTSTVPLTFFVSNGFSSMGYGFPAAMAAKLCRRESPVVCVTGDGGFSMMLQDLETAVRLKLPVVVLVFCDESLGLIELVQRKRGYARYGVTFLRVNFATVARGFGARGLKLRSLEELPGILSSGFSSDRPTVVHVPIDGSEYMGQL